ncbi:O-antigen ligase family protein [Pedobacter changchengzhani]|uniref:O-antigen ligase family protein n=1 Tax=Pedobacter changchengzhani TaxID=2529274 RepID=A0A4V6PJ97_9SPHI|nr:O-antigen ligase family protein [Pedobacter changchengzhani]TDG37133.1 O-antigen ligase family protein [Pedobacter changchengzhani]
MLKNKKIATLNYSSKVQEKSTDFNNNIVTAIITMYLLVEASPSIDMLDQMGFHWLLISILNICSLLFILKRKIIQDSQLISFFKNGLTLVYCVFFMIAGMSLFVAINPTEGIVVYARVFSTIAAFLIIGILLYNRLAVLKNIALIITILTLAQAFGTVTQFYKQLRTVSVYDVISNLQGTSGNKNIWAASFVIKIPFIFYTVFLRKGFVKFLALISLGLSVFCILLISARSAYISLILELFILFGLFCYVFIKENNFKGYLISSTLVIMVLLFSFFVSQNSLNSATKAGDNNSLTVGARLGGIADNVEGASNGRIGYWKGAIGLIKKRPLSGVGIGNWKLYTPLYTNTLVNENIFSKHPHNDFLEVAGETGVINAFIYLSIFALAFFFMIKVVFSKSDLETKMIAVIAFSALSGYFVDACFNFPAERPNIQVLFAISLALITVNYLKLNPVLSTEKANRFVGIFCATMLLFGIGATYVSANVFTSSKAQYIVDNDLASIDAIDFATPKLKFDEVNLMFPKIPNIGENSETIGYKKAKYLYKEKRLDEAIKLLDSVRAQSPYVMYGDYLKCNIYLEEKKLDSAFKYAKIVAHATPRNYYYYRMASYLARVNDDVPEIRHLFKNYNKYRNDLQSWSYYSLSMFYSKADRDQVKKVVNLGLKEFPTDSLMLSYKSQLQ